MKRQIAQLSQVPTLRLPRVTAAQGSLVKGLERLAALSFGLLLLLSLTTPSWRYGPFAWLPLAHFPELAGGPVALGLFNLLPIGLLLSWLGGRALARAWRVESETTRPWQWGRPAVTLPLLALTVWGALSLRPGLDRITFIQGGGLALAWLVYLYAVNQRPRLQVPLALIAAIQGLVAVLQFYRQQDVGLGALGELPLDPGFYGVTVLWARDIPWLRAYGLTAHPNLLGAILTAALLLLLPSLGRRGELRPMVLVGGFSLGLLGLVASFSRAAGLAFVVGLATWLALSYEPWRPGSAWRSALARARRPKFLLPFVAVLLFTLFYGDLLLSRLVALDTPIEAESLARRASDSALAWEIIGRHPWRGVGLGDYTDVAVTLDANAARVHNVVLLTAAELGIPGFIFWAWLALAPLFYWRLSRRRPRLRLSLAPARATAPWVAMLVVGCFDTTLWLTGNWQTAVLFALLAANASETRPVAAQG